MLRLLLLFSVVLLVSAHEDNKTPKFEGSEHREAGNTGFILTFNPSNPSYVLNYTAGTFPFTNQAGTNLFTYGDIVAFGGDFFGPEQELMIVCTTSSDVEAQALFYDAFSKLWNTQDSAYIKRIRDEMQKELNEVAKNPNNYPYTAYSKLPESRWGNVFPSFLEMALLLTNNLDHFTTCAQHTYQVGHLLAMQTAMQASNQLQKCINASSTYDCNYNASLTLMKAYAINAFSDHFLTDLFSSGHIRTPRRLITGLCNSGSSYVNSFLGGYSSGGLASQWMHDEDNRNGLLVTNQRGDIWNAFGDDSYFDYRNTQNRRFIAEAVQISRNEVFGAFQFGNISYGAMTLIPDASQLEQFTPNNTCPLFNVDHSDYGVIYIRDNEQIRPPSWRAANGFPGNPNQIHCDYVKFTLDLCPTALTNKAEALLPTFITRAYTQQLVHSRENDAWITIRPDPNVYSYKPRIVLGLSAFAVAFTVSLFGWIFEMIHAKWLGPFRQRLPVSGVEEGEEDETLGDQVKYILLTTIIPSFQLLLFLLGAFAIVKLLGYSGYISPSWWAMFFLVGFFGTMVWRSVFYLIGYCIIKRSK